MSDDTGWAAPGGRHPLPLPGYGPPPGAAAGPPSGPGWSPPPSPGLMPLHPLGFGTLLGIPFRELRRNPRPVVGTSLIVQAVVMIASLFVTGAVGLTAYDRVAMAAPAERATVLSGAVAGFLLSLLVPVVLGLLGSAFLQGVIVADVARGTLGERLSLRQLWHAARRRLAPLVGWVLLLAAGITVLVAAVAAIVWLSLTAGGPAMIIGIVAAVFVGIAALIVGVWLYVKTSLVPCLIVLERRGVRSSLGRSWLLTGGLFWRMFGVQALVAVIVNAISQVATTPLGLAVGIVGGIVAPTGSAAGGGGAESGTGRAALIALYAATLLVTLLVSALTTVVQSAAVAVLYLDARMRKEGLALHLTRYVEERAAEREDPPDPFETPAAGAAPKGSSGEVS